MVNENEIVCGNCGNEGYIGEGFDIDWAMSVASNAPCGKIVCGECGSSILFDPLMHIDIDDIVYHSCDEDWSADEED